jgi:predicted methyltransferase
MSRFIPLTEVAQQAVRSVLGPGDLTVDATVGNGHDTLFLAGKVVPGGHVIGFDIQPQAIEQTHARLLAVGLDADVTLQLCGHERMREQLPAGWAGRVSAVMFNLGYLPGSDKCLTTSVATTLSALDQALSLLRVGGLVSLLVYRGHPGAGAEAAALARRLEHLEGRFQLDCKESPGPILYLIRRIA